MLITSKKTARRGFTLIELLVVIAIIGILSAVILPQFATSRSRGRDATRLSEIREIKYALELYYQDYGNYPTCLYSGGSCVTTLQGSKYMNSVPTDPLTGLGYTYAANGSGSICNSYHLGASLENKGNAALISTPNASPRAICTGSNADFTGLSYAAGGQLCNTTAGLPQPTNAATGESCYDQIP